MPPAGPITVRRPAFDLGDLPRHWVAGSRLGTSFGNAGHVFIPLGEQFFIDTVKRFAPRVSGTPTRDIKAFIGQEAVHKRAHEQLWDVLQRQGVPVRPYQQSIRLLRGLERVLPPTLCLSVTAALEHYTAAFAHAFLTEDLADEVPPEMARLLAWHGLEELEHRSVVFDVLQEVDDSYPLRVAGFAIATVLMTAVPLTGVGLFALVDVLRRPAPPRRPSLALRRLSLRFGKQAAGHLVAYLQPGFHPSCVDVPDRASEWRSRLDAGARREGA